MAFSEILVGIEIGTSKVRCVVAEVDDEGNLNILGTGRVDSLGVRKGEIVDMKLATECVHDALAAAESNSDVRIEEVITVVTGGHIQSFNSRGSIRIERGDGVLGEIEQADIDAVVAKANEVSLPAEHTFLHNSIQHYFVDGQAGVLDPTGLVGSQLDADVHIIHGIKNRVQNTVGCIEKNDVDIASVVVAPLASAHAATETSQRDLGVLVIDVGGGVTDWIVFAEGVVCMSGVLAVGGDHIDNDIAIGLHLPLKRASRLKETDGSASLAVATQGEMISLKNEGGFAGKEVSREMLNTIIHLRMKEIFEIIQRQVSKEISLKMLGTGVVLTGGGSNLAGIGEVAEGVFGVPVQIGRETAASGPKSVLNDPCYATVIGAIRQRHRQMLDEEDTEEGFFGKLKGFFKR